MPVPVSVLGRPVIRGFRSALGCLVVVVLPIAVLAPAIAFAQPYSGSLTGIVTDPSGGGIPLAKVTVTDVGKGFTYTATTNAIGRYLLRPLPPSTYTSLRRCAI
jgi:carboxypeptidase family protein